MRRIVHRPQRVLHRAEPLDRRHSGLVAAGRLDGGDRLADRGLELVECGALRGVSSIERSICGRRPVGRGSGCAAASALAGAAAAVFGRFADARACCRPSPGNKHGARRECGAQHVADAVDAQPLAIFRRPEREADNVLVGARPSRAGRPCRAATVRPAAGRDGRLVAAALAVIAGRSATLRCAGAGAGIGDVPVAAGSPMKPRRLLPLRLGRVRRHPDVAAEAARPGVLAARGCASAAPVARRRGLLWPPRWRRAAAGGLGRRPGRTCMAAWRAGAGSPAPKMAPSGSVMIPSMLAPGGRAPRSAAGRRRPPRGTRTNIVPRRMNRPPAFAANPVIEGRAVARIQRRRPLPGSLRGQSVYNTAPASVPDLVSPGHIV